MLFALLTTAIGCTTTVDSTNSEQTNNLKKRYEILLQFASLEDVKRVPYQLPNLKMELLKEVSTRDNIYQASILCKEHALEGTLQKLNTNMGISWAKRID